MKIIPAIDVKNGSCVRLLQGDFDRQTEYSKKPAHVADAFAQLDVSELHVVDLDGARSGSQLNQESILDIAASGHFTIQLGGGIRSAESIRYWLDHGISRVVIGSLAVTDPDLVRAWLEQFGAAQIVLALDVRLGTNGVPMLATHGWTMDSETTLWRCLDGFRDAGVSDVLCTDISRDGAMAGPSLALYEEFVRRYPDVSLQASGGVRDIDDLQRLRQVGAMAAITGRALLDGKISAAEISAFRRDA